MTEVAWAEQFLGRFALPLVQGGAVQIGVPLLRRGAKRLLQAIAQGLDGTPVAEALAEARQRGLLELLPGAQVPRLSDDPMGAQLLIGLHDLLFLQHPAAARFSEPQGAQLHSFVRQLGERAATQLPIAATGLPADLRGPAPSPVDAQQRAQAEQQLLSRHSLLGGLFRLWRGDTRAATLWGEREYRGVKAPVPRLRALLGRAPRALPEPHKVRILPELLAQSESAATVRALVAASPLTALLPPAGCGILPALAEQAAWLRVPAVARLVVAHYLALGAGSAVAEAGGAVSALLHPAAHPVPSGDLMTLLCLVGHLHLCVALSEAPLPTAQASGAARDSYALYIAVAARWPRLAAPGDVRGDPRLSARLASYLQACRSVAGPASIRAFDELCQVALAAPG